MQLIKVIITFAPLNRWLKETNDEIVSVLRDYQGAFSMVRKSSAIAKVEETNSTMPIMPGGCERPPTKEEIIAILKAENPPIVSDKKYSQLFVILEFKKVSTSIGIIKGELYNNDEITYRGSFLMPLSNELSNGDGEENKSSVWKSLELGHSTFYGFSLDARELSITEKLGQMVSRSIEEGKIQEFIPSIFK